MEKTHTNQKRTNNNRVYGVEKEFNGGISVQQKFLRGLVSAPTNKRWHHRLEDERTAEGGNGDEAGTDGDTKAGNAEVSRVDGSVAGRGRG